MSLRAAIRRARAELIRQGKGVLIIHTPHGRRIQVIRAARRP